MRIAWIVVLASFVVVALPPAADVSGEDRLAAALDNLKEARSSRNAAAICKAVRALACVDGAKADRELRRVAAGDKEDIVCAEACRALGERGHKSSLAILLRLLEAYGDRPHALIGAIEGVSAFRSPRAVEPLYDVAREGMLRQEKVTRAAIEALGDVRHPRAVERLVALLRMTEQRRGWGPNRVESAGPTSSTTATQLSTYRPGIVASLQSLTGLGLEEIDDWSEWWRSAKRGYRLPPAPEDPNATLDLVDSAGRYGIRRPSIAWKWVKSPEPGFHRTCERRVGGSRVAWLSIRMHCTSDEDPVSVEGMLQLQKTNLESSFRTVRESDWAGTVALAGRTVRRQRVCGCKDGAEVSLTQGVFTRGTCMFVVRWAVCDGASREVQAEAERFVASFCLED